MNDSQDFDAASVDGVAIQTSTPIVQMPRRTSSASRPKRKANRQSTSIRPMPSDPSSPAEPEPGAMKFTPSRNRLRRESSSGDHGLLDDQYDNVSGHADHSVIGDLIAELTERRREYVTWTRAQTALANAAHGQCVRLLMEADPQLTLPRAWKKAPALYKAALAATSGSESIVQHAALKVAPFEEAHAAFDPARKAAMKRIEALAKRLPAADFIDATRGVGFGLFGAIIGEAGDLGRYASPAKLWKRMGLAVMPDGGRQRRVTGDAAIAHAYSPGRRSLMWNVGSCIIKAGGPLRELYDARKAYELGRGMPRMHAHNRAKRYIEKRLLRDLWRAWRRAISAVSPDVLLPVSEPIAEPAVA